MIYLLGGIAKSGKTYVARRILAERRISVFSTDHLMMALAKGDPERRIDPDADDRIVARALEPYLSGMIATMVAGGQDQLIEGVHLLPDFAARLATAYPGRIRAVFLGYRLADPLAKMRELLSHADGMENAWFLSYSPERMNALVRMLIEDSARLHLEAELHRMPYVEIADIVKDADAVIDRLFASR